MKKFDEWERKRVRQMKQLDMVLQYLVSIDGDVEVVRYLMKLRDCLGICSYPGGLKDFGIRKKQIGEGEK